jgi:hypothetical protein
LLAQGLAVSETQGGFAIDDGEVRLDVSAARDRFEVEKTWRDTDRGTLMASPRWEDVERFLTVFYANAARMRRGYRPLRPIARPATGPGALAPGFRLTGDLDQGFSLTVPVQEETREIVFASDIDAAKFSRYVDLTPDELRERVLRESPILLD